MPVRLVSQRLLPFLLALSLLALAGAVATRPAVAAVDDGTLAQQMRELIGQLDSLSNALAANDAARARADFATYDQTWDRYEDGVRDKSPDAYRAIESAAGAVKAAVQANPIDQAKARTAVQTLRTTINDFVGTLQPSGGPRTGGLELPSGGLALAGLTLAGAGLWLVRRRRAA